MPIDTSQNPTLAGSVELSDQLIMNRIRAYYDESSNGGDLRANLRITANLSTSQQNGLYINYGSTGAANAHCRFFANGTTQRMHINADTGNVGIGVEASAAYKLQVNGKGHFGDVLDTTAYGELQITRAITQPDNKHYISMVRAGNAGCGLGFINSTSKMYTKTGFVNTGVNGICIDNNKIGINKTSPTEALDVDGNIFVNTKLDVQFIRGGRGNSAKNFHLDNYENNAAYSLYCLAAFCNKVLVWLHGTQLQVRQVASHQTLSMGALAAAKT